MIKLGVIDPLEQDMSMPYFLSEHTDENFVIHQWFVELPYSV
jgi:hypothetical protein